MAGPYLCAWLGLDLGLRYPFCHPVGHGGWVWGKVLHGRWGRRPSRGYVWERQRSNDPDGCVTLGHWTGVGGSRDFCILPIIPRMRRSWTALRPPSAPGRRGSAGAR